MAKNTKKKNQTSVEGRTLDIVKTEASAKVDELNLATAPEIRMDLEVAAQELVKEYNELALLTAYSEARKAELPVVQLARMLEYNTIALKRTEAKEVVDGKAVRVTTFGLTDKKSALNILKFVKWLEERNIKLPSGWIGRMSAVKANIIAQWKAFDEASGDECVFRIGELKRLLQPMVDDLGFIKGENGGNALVAKSVHARTMLKYANTLKGALSGETLTPKVWDSLLMSVMHSIATDGVFENTYGSSAVYKEDADDEADAEVKTEVEAK